MELFFDTKSIRNLVKVLYNIPTETKKVYASIAYSTSHLLLDKVIEKKIELDWYGLFNSDEATKLELLEKALKYKQYIKFYPIIDVFHPKVIYFENYGIYIGSANMTEKALNYNIEAGIFLTSKEITLNEAYLNQIVNYFKELNLLSTPLTDDDVQIYREFINEKKAMEIDFRKNEIDKQLENQFKSKFPHYIKPKEGAKNFSNLKDKSQLNKKIEFIREWKATQHELTIIMDKIRVESILPIWVPETDAYGVVADQFLHMYYYYKVQDDDNDKKSVEIVDKLYLHNRANKEKVLEDALNWWKSTSQPLFGEDKHINEWCPINRNYLSRENILNLNQLELIDMLKHIHSARAHARQIKKSVLGLPEGHITEDQCIEAYGKWLSKEKSGNGNNVIQNMSYLLYDDKEPVEERLYKLLEDDQYRLKHFGKSIIGEIIGWAMPEKYPIRNNRVNKALRALGFDVEVS